MGKSSDVVTSDGTRLLHHKITHKAAEPEGLWVFKKPKVFQRQLCRSEISGVPGRQIRKSLSGLMVMTDGGTSTSGTLKTF